MTYTDFPMPLVKEGLPTDRPLTPMASFTPETMKTTASTHSGGQKHENDRTRSAPPLARYPIDQPGRLSVFYCQPDTVPYLSRHGNSVQKGSYGSIHFFVHDCDYMDHHMNSSLKIRSRLHFFPTIPMDFL